jgi:hypothetical protein
VLRTCALLLLSARLCAFPDGTRSLVPPSVWNACHRSALDSLNVCPCAEGGGGKMVTGAMPRRHTAPKSHRYLYLGEREGKRGGQRERERKRERKRKKERERVSVFPFGPAAAAGSAATLLHSKRQKLTCMVSMLIAHTHTVCVCVCVCVCVTHSSIRS